MNRLECRTVWRTVAGLCAVLLFSLLMAGSTQAQFYFGKNKVQYTRFDWQVMTTDHFRIYFYRQEDRVAKVAAQYAESAYDSLAPKFNLEISRKIPLIIYSSPSYFAQTNVIPGMLPQSVAGFTEFMKGRVVIPFHGSFFDFNHVIRHEVIHVFSIAKLVDHYNRRARFKAARPPLWFTEGLAEFWSEEWDVQADMMLKDMVLTNNLLPISQFWKVRGSYYMYKLGQSVCEFIDSTYGSDKLVRIYENWHKGKNFDEIIEVTLGVNLNELSRKWEYSLKKKYFPELAEYDLPQMESEQLTEGGFALRGVPVQWDDGDEVQEWIVFKANRMGYTGIYARPIGGETGKVRTLLKGERSSDLESLYLMQSGLDATDDGRIVFSSKSKESDVLYIYDFHRDKIIQRFEFTHLVAARSPKFSPDGTRVVFSGVGEDGYTNIYVIDLSDGKYTTVTSDIYFDTEPVFSLNGRDVIFSSDRCPDGPEGGINLYKVGIDSRRIVRLTTGHHRDLGPAPSPRGIYFASDREGSHNIFLLQPDGRITRQSTFATGAFDPRPTSDGKALIYTGYQALRYQVYRMDVIDDPKPVEHRPASASRPWQPPQIDGQARATTIKYDSDYSFDIAQSSIGYDPVYGSIGGFQVALSDMLGNKMVYFLLTNTADTKDELLESFNIGITYINRERRLNWGVGAFHLYDEYFNEFDQYFLQREAGAISLLSYPISKFSRFDFTTLARYSKRERRFGLGSREAFLVSNRVSWIYDNSLWEVTGPIEGRRYNLTVGITNSVDRLRNFSRLAMIDIRHYFRLGRNSAFANRLFAFSSSGLEPQRIYLGGSWSFRGFSRRAFYNRKVLFASSELRFPLIDRLLIGFPIGGLGFSGIRGALFFDTGSAWDDEFDQFLGSFGAGFRVALGYIVTLRFDFSRITDFETISSDTDFDFFFGWNF